ncbi:MAG: hypothetical protein WAO24_00705, partial [Peptococcia bacterium]
IIKTFLLSLSKLLQFLLFFRLGNRKTRPGVAVPRLEMSKLIPEDVTILLLLYIILSINRINHKLL